MGAQARDRAPSFDNGRSSAARSALMAIEQMIAGAVKGNAG